MGIEEIPEYINALKSNATRSLQAIGYYKSEISAKHSSYKTSTTIKLHIKAGAPSRLRAIEINLSSNDNDRSEFHKELRSLELMQGQVFNHGTYEQAKAKLVKTAQFLGYFDAKFNRSQVLISKTDNSADVFIDYDLGDRYNISHVIYNQDLFTNNFLSKWQNFETTVPYRASYVRDLTVNLQKSGYFNKVRVVPDIQSASNYELPLIVDLTPTKENSVGMGIGFATDTKLRFKTNWLRPHTNRHGHTFESNASVSKSRQDFSVGYRLPQKSNPANNTYSLDIGLLNERTDDTFSQQRTLEIAEHRLTKSKWQRNLFIRLENNRFDVGDSTDKINLLLPGVELTRLSSTSGIHPNKGRYFSMRIMAAQRSFFSDLNMLKATATGKLLTSWDEKNYLIARTELGALHTSSFDRVPTTHRYFAGGDNSIRGYSYQEISPKNENNESIGGQFLTTASVEYNRYFSEKFAVAAFTDAGRAFSDNSEPTRIGIGIGLRWRSPVGSLRIDLAHGIDNDNSPYRIHLAIGPEL